MQTPKKNSETNVFILHTTTDQDSKASSSQKPSQDLCEFQLDFSLFYALFSLCSTITMLSVWGVLNTVVNPESSIFPFTNGLIVCILNVLCLVASSKCLYLKDCEISCLLLSPPTRPRQVLGSLCSPVMLRVETPLDVAVGILLGIVQRR